eukprot:TRINITY_DN4924_c2_g1_i1.p1 TRINITY_DN4924_c2_g1~~TRINITY_DN4924_c2_g1_i1.p1  ORF type:complete len:766 (+),score=264.12 TRINITY_DN4924_c2_g1_i1:171-2468(+)
MNGSDKHDIPAALLTAQSLGERLSVKCSLVCPLRGTDEGDLNNLVREAYEVMLPSSALQPDTLNSYAAQVVESCPASENPLPTCQSCGVEQRLHSALFCHACGTALPKAVLDAREQGRGAGEEGRRGTTLGGALKIEHLMVLHLRYTTAAFLSVNLSEQNRCRALADLKAQALSLVLLQRLLKSNSRRKGRRLFWHLLTTLSEGDEIFLPLSWAQPPRPGASLSSPRSGGPTPTRRASMSPHSKGAVPIGPPRRRSSLAAVAEVTRRVSLKAAQARSPRGQRPASAQPQPQPGSPLGAATLGTFVGDSGERSHSPRRSVWAGATMGITRPFSADATDPMLQRRGSRQGGASPRRRSSLSGFGELKTDAEEALDVCGTIFVCFRRSGGSVVARVDCVDQLLCDERHKHWMKEDGAAELSELESLVCSYVVTCVDAAALPQAPPRQVLADDSEDIAMSPTVAQKEPSSTLLSPVSAGKPKKKRASLCPWVEAEDTPLDFDTAAAVDVGAATATARTDHFIGYCAWLLEKVSSPWPVALDELLSRAYDRGDSVLAAMPDAGPGARKRDAAEKLEDWLHSRCPFSRCGLPLTRATQAVPPVQVLNLLHGSLVRAGNTRAAMRYFGSFSSFLQTTATAEAAAKGPDAAWAAFGELFPALQQPLAAADVRPSPPLSSATPHSSASPVAASPEAGQAAPPAPKEPQPQLQPPAPASPSRVQMQGANHSLRSSYAPLHSAADQPSAASDSVPFWVRRLRGLLDQAASGDTAAP